MAFPFTFWKKWSSLPNFSTYSGTSSSLQWRGKIPVPLPQNTVSCQKPSKRILLGCFRLVLSFVIFTNVLSGISPKKLLTVDLQWWGQDTSLPPSLPPLPYLVWPQGRYPESFMLLSLLEVFFTMTVFVLTPLLEVFLEWKVKTQDCWYVEDVEGSWQETWRTGSYLMTGITSVEPKYHILKVLCHYLYFWLKYKGVLIW